jgi:hypothetical protein
MQFSLASAAQVNLNGDRHDALSHLFPYLGEEALGNLRIAAQEATSLRQPTHVTR